MKLTSREREIVEALQKEPLISQDELALHFGISRSSVAVHISNLMKKGVILGKGYVFNKRVSIVVIGQAYMEIRIQEADHTMIDMQYAGFSLEVCNTLADYGAITQIITVVGNDDLGNSILKQLQANDVDITHIYRHSEKRTCKRIVSGRRILFEEGFVHKDFQQAIAAREWVASNCDWLIVEPEFTEMLGNKILNRTDRTPVLCGCWYTDGKAVPDFLKNYNLLVLGTANFQDYDFYINKGLELVETGTKNCIITDGSHNMIWLNDEGSRDFPLPPNQNFNSCTDLHLFLAGLVHGLSAGYPMRQALRIASGAAHLNREGA
ncbi:MAG: PfkB family carbohydrate kinase [Syntrophomonadaceae bacterium]|nr:PfkB family carbohydrate kinase [Syntrophomonadaceae bacterium]